MSSMFIWTSIISSKSKYILSIPLVNCLKHSYSNDCSIKIQEITPRFWVSAGSGELLLSPSGCPTSVFYAVVIDDGFSQLKEGG